MAILLINDVPMACINYAAATYHVPPALVLSILKTEGGRNGLAKKNANGTFDYGPMQINSTWLSKLVSYKISKTDLQYNPCKNVAVGTWILSQAIASGKTLLSGIGYYHSHEVHLNTQYAYKIANEFNKINQILSRK